MSTIPHGSFLTSGYRRAVVGVLAIILSALLPAVVHGAETVETLTSRGLVHFHQQQYPEALALFDQAVAADQQDAYARYYRGATYMQLRRVPEAIADFRVALASRPEMTQAQLEMGVALVETEQFAEAIPYLERAQSDLPEQAPRAALFLGIAHLRLDQIDAARDDFERAAADPDLLPTARYYQGVLDYLEQRWDEAHTHFEFVASARPGTAIAVEAQQFLDRLASRRTRNYELYALAGIEYDSNVSLVPIDDAAQVRQGVTGAKADGRAILGAGGVYVPWHNDWAQLSVGYDFFQSLQFDLNDFNLQDHRPSVQLAGTKGAFRFGMFARYDFYLLGSREFLQQGTGVPFVSYDEGDFGRTELFMRGRRRDFLRSPYRVLDSWNYGPGVRQIFNLGTDQRSAWIGYRFDREDTLKSDGDGFAYDGHEFSVGLIWIIGEPYRADISYSLRYEDYDAASDGRDDYVHLPIAALRWDMSDHVAVTVAYLGTFNDSNKSDFEYNRNIASVSVTVSN